ncbi:protein IQ-DOMAIN 19 [Lolium perenne]|uniref:protein IQ-DOMAIN 19 n=1 Tax=Lolium perenne TaxID=4522 RepID=UPI0021F5CE57|nr:protein IQ-DOMAIN 19-like [Lolium perenne]XP_051223057.1 protein IQ-DOMAIN 19-like [Lolium perenne]
MGKAGKWLRSILAGKKDGGRRRGNKQGQCDATPLAELPAAASPREKKRWSFRKPGKAATPSPLTPEPSAAGGVSVSVSERELEQSKHAVAVAVATAVATDAAVAAAAAVIRLTAAEAEDELYACPIEEAAASKIQATFRGYLARKALCALRGLVKLQALIRGQLVRKQAHATLRRMQALLMAQTRLRAQRMRMLEDDDAYAANVATVERRSPQHPRRRRSYEMDRSGEEHAKIVEMDTWGPPRPGRSSCSVATSESRERRQAEYYGAAQCSPAPSAAFTEHFEYLEPATARVGPYVPASVDDDGESVSEFFPNYMANTQSSRAKARSQSAPRQRPYSPSPLDRQPSRRRGGAAPVPRSVKMQRSSSHVGVPSSAAGDYAQYQHQYHPWPVKLDRSSVSLKGSECGSTSSVLTAATTVGYCRSLVGFEVQRSQY